MKINTIHNIFFYMAAALAIVNGLTACSDKDESFLAGTGSVLRSADEINLTSGGVAKVFTVCAKGEWNIETAASWLHFSKTSGTGDGNNREQILVSADHNISASRLDSFVLKAAGRELITRVTQAEGHATLLGEATLSSTLQAEKSLEGVSIRIPYTYGYAGQKLTVTPTLTGVPTQGITASPVTVTLSHESGVIELPLSGAPSAKGKVDINIVTDDPTINAVQFSTTVVGRVIFQMHFDKFIWGGDLITGKGGIIGSNWVTNAAGERTGEATFSDCSWSSEPGDLLAPGLWSAAFLASREMTGWTGTKGMEHPGYIKMGTGATVGILTTPAIGSVPADGTVNLSFRVAMYPHRSEHSTVIDIRASAGTPSVSAYRFRHVSDNKSSTWEDVSLTVTGATSLTKITFTCHGGCRFLIDDIVVTE